MSFYLKAYFSVCGPMALSSINELVGTGFASRSRLQTRAGVLRSSGGGGFPLSLSEWSFTIYV